MDLWAYENTLREGYGALCGIDEAGRGPLAGPVFAAAVILPPNVPLNGLNDSKKLTEKARERLYGEILSVCLACGVAFADEHEIDSLNILNATMLAMNRAASLLSAKPSLALIDGNQNTGILLPSRCVVGGDGKCASIAAASILAKVTRDRYMRALAEKYPQYGFEQHKGYGTKLHYERLREYGPSPVHRTSFLGDIDSQYARSGTEETAAAG